MMALYIYSPLKLNGYCLLRFSADAEGAIDTGVYFCRNNRQHIYVVAFLAPHLRLADNGNHRPLD